MSFFDILKGSLATLKTNKLRTLLTMLGIIIGISSVIAMWAIGNGGRDSILGDLKKVGYGKFTVTIDYKNENFVVKTLSEKIIPAEKLGFKTVLVKTGYGMKNISKLADNGLKSLVVGSISEFGDFISDEFQKI